MKRKPRYLDPEASSRWIISYTDLLTVLLIFFVAISAQRLRNPPPHSGPGALSPQRKARLVTVSHTQRDQPANPRPRATPPPPTAAPTPAGPREALLRAQRILQRQGLNLRLEPRGLVISLPQAILFPSGQDRVSPAALPMVGQIADVLREIPSKVSLVGHADAVPIHNRHFKSNWELSAARSLKLLELLHRRYGIPESRLSIAGYGSYSPRNLNDTESGRAGNRRVEIIILDELAR